jgi:hypothetical protein
MATNRIGFSSNFVLVNNKIGIGTASPAAALDVRGDLLVSAGSSTGQYITQRAYELNSGTLSWEGTAGQLFSITNNLTSGSIFSVNDVSGIPSIDVDANGTVSLVSYGGSVGVGITNPSQSLHVQGNARITGALYDSSNTTGSSGQILSSTGSAISWINASSANVGSANSIAITTDSTDASRYVTFVSTTSGNNLVYVDSDLLYNPSTNSLVINSTSFTGTASQNLQVTGGGYVSGNVGIGTTLPQYKLHVVGDFGATTKSFSIPHPTKPGLTLRHGSLEGPENGVYVRGKTTESSIPLPDYWTGLVDEESISVNLTPKNGKLHSVVGISSNAVEIECIGGEIDCYFMILGERKDVAKLDVEY